MLTALQETVSSSESCVFDTYSKLHDGTVKNVVCLINSEFAGKGCLAKLDVYIYIYLVAIRKSKQSSIR